MPASIPHAIPKPRPLGAGTAVHPAAFATARAIHDAAIAAERLNIGRHDWYRDLARQLLERQADDGAWRPEGGNADDTLRATAVALIILHSRLPVPRTAGR